MNGWKEYRTEPCPICGHKHWCGHSDDGAVVHCMRVESPKPCPSGGWIHILQERPKTPLWRVPRRRAARVPVLNAERVMAGFRAEFDKPIIYDEFDSFAEVSEELKLDEWAINRIGIGRSAEHQAWAFPMRDDAGHVIGIRLREYGGSRKWAVTGSRDGLFFDPDLQPQDVPVKGSKSRDLVIVEGATDAIAGTQIGLPCVGRSSCGTGGDLLLRLCSRLRVERVTIVADNDRYKSIAEGRIWRPGVDGAIRLAAKLRRTYRIVIPPTKDLRDWVAAGLTAETFWNVAALQPCKLSTKGINEPLAKNRNLDA